MEIVMDSYRDRYRQMKIELGMDGDEVSKMNQKLDRLETSTARPFKVWIS
jgi:flagellar biosynthesis chaperone FliJ